MFPGRFEDGHPLIGASVVVRVPGREPRFIRALDLTLDFGADDLAHWSAELDRAGLIWAPVATMPEMIADAQVAEMGWIASIEAPSETYEVLNTPFKIYGSSMGARGAAPTIGQHTFEVLAEYGVEGEELGRLVNGGVVG